MRGSKSQTLMSTWKQYKIQYLQDDVSGAKEITYKFYRVCFA